MDYFHGFCPLSPWKKSMDILEKIHGHTGKNPWTFSMDSLEIVQFFPWILSTDSMDFGY